MNYFKDSTSSIDEQIRSKMYNGLTSEADGIDLRIEFNRILYGSSTKKPLGHWVVLRLYDSSSKSEYFNKYSKEGILGPTHKYKDVLVRTRNSHTLREMNTEPTFNKPGELDVSNVKYYFEWNIPINVGDVVFELDVDDHTFKPCVYKFTKKHKVFSVINNRMENGNVQYKTAMVTLDHIAH